MSQQEENYTFMRSGFNIVEDNSEEKLQQQVAGTMVHFIENALGTAKVYTNHANRNTITSEDIKRAMMLEVFFFSKRINKEEKINEIINEIYAENSDSEEEDIIEINEDDAIDEEEDAFNESNCNCALCTCLNNIYTKWDTWEPSTGIQIILKNRISEM
jgi:hypothetical protein|tara:strand:+ start:425 stop:901 length:477 start_codon:yes stop_codon:yes gene_type:complete